MLAKSDVTRGKWMVAAAVAVAIAGARADGAELNTLRDLQIVPTGSGAQVVVAGTRPPTFTVFRLSGPERLVVDLSSADATAIKGHHNGTGPVTGIVASQFSDERASVGRVLVALDKTSQYDVRADGNRVIISVDGTTPQASTASADKPAAEKAPVMEPAPAVAKAAEPAPAKPAPVVAQASQAQAQRPWRRPEPAP